MTSAITPISSEALALALTLRDLSDPTHGSHAMQLMLEQITAAASRELNLPLRLERPSPVVTVEENYDELLIGKEAASRAVRYSRYVDETHMLRSHTSAAMPRLLRAVALDSNPRKPVLIAVPGLVYRRDQVDRTHVSEPHQLDLWSLSEEKVTQETLRRLMGTVAQTVLPGCPWRTLEASHPYTVDGLQLEVLKDGEWLELAEGGLIHPDILRRTKMAAGVGGLALGLGLDRALMVRKGIPDIRYLRSTSAPIQSQLLELSPWLPVSSMPATKRDLSVSVDEHLDVEILGDLCREALGDDSHLLEEVVLLSQATYEELPKSAHERLGMKENQVNVLVRVILRPLSRTLSAAEANELRDRIYLKLHRGINRSELISGGRSS